MTDNEDRGLAALAAAVQEADDKWNQMESTTGLWRDFMAAALDGHDGPTKAEHNHALRLAADEIATLRAALELVVAQKWWRNWGAGQSVALDAARAALATVQETQPTDDDTTEPDPNRTGMPKCPRCGDIAFRPDPVDWRKPAWRCGGCHRTLGRCNCAALATAKEAGG
jgi:ribosomal protein S27AE